MACVYVCVCVMAASASRDLHFVRIARILTLESRDANSPLHQCAQGLVFRARARTHTHRRHTEVPIDGAWLHTAWRNREQFEYAFNFAMQQRRERSISTAVGNWHRAHLFFSYPIIPDAFVCVCVCIVIARRCIPFNSFIHHLFAFNSCAHISTYYHYHAQLILSALIANGVPEKRKRTCEMHSAQHTQFTIFTNRYHFVDISGAASASATVVVNGDGGKRKISRNTPSRHLVTRQFRITTNPNSERH